MTCWFVFGWAIYFLFVFNCKKYYICKVNMFHGVFEDLIAWKEA